MSSLLTLISIICTREATYNMYTVYVCCKTMFNLEIFCHFAGIRIHISEPHTRTHIRPPRRRTASYNIWWRLDNCVLLPHLWNVLLHSFLHFMRTRWWHCKHISSSYTTNTCLHMLLLIYPHILMACAVQYIFNILKCSVCYVQLQTEYDHIYINMWTIFLAFI